MPAASVTLVVAAVMVEAGKGWKGQSWQIQEATLAATTVPQTLTWQPLTKMSGAASHHTDIGASRSHGDFSEVQPTVMVHTMDSGGTAATSGIS